MAVNGSKPQCFTTSIARAVTTMATKIAPCRHAATDGLTPCPPYPPSGKAPSRTPVHLASECADTGQKAKDTSVACIEKSDRSTIALASVAHEVQATKKAKRGNSRDRKKTPRQREQSEQLTHAGVFMPHRDERLQRPRPAQDMHQTGRSSTSQNHVNAVSSLRGVCPSSDKFDAFTAWAALA